MPKKSKIKYILTELAHHLPFSVFGVTLGIIAMGLLNFVATLAGNYEAYMSASAGLFHVFHASHILLSAVATTAMFYKHEKRVAKAVIVGFAGSVTICGLSDVIFPFIGGLILGADMHFHICLIEEPALVYPFAVIGVIAGLMMPQAIKSSTQYSHSAHVFVSSFASILYLVSFGLVGWVHLLGGVFLVTIFAVMIPCCASDIIFPLTCVHRDCHHPDVMEEHSH